MNPENLDDSLMDASCDSTLTQLGAGAQIGRYRIERSLGAGGMGEVFRAHDTRLGRSIRLGLVSRGHANPWRLR
jgi:serine/threonine protein kinase